jgi:hypothetical protein
MELIFAICLLWGGFLCGVIYCRGFAKEEIKEEMEPQKAKTSFRSPLVRFE